MQDQAVGDVISVTAEALKFDDKLYQEFQAAIELTVSIPRT